MKFVPVIVTSVPPPVGPVFGLRPETAGAAMNWNRSLALVALVPPAVVTVTSTVAAGASGDTASIDVSPFTVKLVAAVPPKPTAVAPVNPVPVMLTVVPPVAGPEVGETAVTLGAGTNPGARSR